MAKKMMPPIVGQEPVPTIAPKKGRRAKKVKAFPKIGKNKAVAQY